LVLAVEAPKTAAGTLSGLLGNFDGNPRNDIAPKGGTAITPSFDALYPRFADSWRITQATSLFDYPPGASTATFTDRSFPDGPATTASLTAAQRTSARAACNAADVRDPTDLDNCTLDVALTGSADFAVGTGELEQFTASGSSTASTPGQQGGAPSATSTTTTATATVTKPDTVAHISFVAKKGQRAFVQVLSTTLPNQCGTLVLRGTDDNSLATGCTTNGVQIDGTLLPSNGVYNIYVDPTGHAVGTITLRVVTSVDQVLAASIGGPPVTAAITAPGAQAQITFAATAGQQIFVDATDATIPDQCGALELEGPGASELALGCLTQGSGYIDGEVLSVSGRYTVIVNPAGDSTGTVSIRVIADHDQTVHTAIGGIAVPVDIAQPGATASVTFSGAVGNKVHVTLSSSTLPDQCGLVTLIAPNQSVLATACVQHGSGTLPTTTLPANGTYTLTVNPDAKGIGALVVRVAGG
jgi:hypothetical protein